jgi:phosphomannomutase
MSRQELIGLLTKEPKISAQALTSIEHWLEDPALKTFTPEIERLVMGGQWEELEDSFYTHLMIGTGGIRGPLGVGPNRINLRTIGEAAQGLCHFIEDYGTRAKQAGVVVGYEARKDSKEFAHLSCEVLAGNGIRSHLFDGIRATPEISFAVRHLRATAGVQITASHNPRTDNGFKFYWSDGAQVVSPHDARFMQLVSDVQEIRRTPFLDAREQGHVSVIGGDVDAEYLGAVRSLSTNNSRSASVVFSPIHGAGSTNVLPVLSDEGFAISTVPEQIQPDETFPTAHGDLINPEYREVMELPVRLAEELGADVAVCSDPDADRVGVAARANWDSTKMQFLTGNQVGAALTHYLLSNRQELGLLSSRHVVLETMVTTSLISDVAQSFGLSVRDDLLVGFKFIAQVIGQLDDPRQFVFAAEESLGYLSGDFVRDKDAAIASLLVCEMASWLKDQGKTVLMYLDDIYRKFGYYKNVQYLVELPGKTGREIMKTVMMYLRDRTPERLAGIPVVGVDDRLSDALRSPDQYRLGGSTDTISFLLSEDRRTRVTVRPSGTEPKLKYYVQHYGAVDEDLIRVEETVDSVAGGLGEAILDYSFHGLPPEQQQEWHHADRREV